MQRLSALERWLDRKAPLHEFSDATRIPDRETGCFIGIDIAVDLHETIHLKPESLAQSWISVHRYMTNALRIIGAEEPSWLDREEVEMIRSDLGDPPPVSYPLYFISVGNDEAEKLVYVGKTSSNNSRFKGGHTAITRLHDPKYNTLSKKLYLATIFFYDKDYLPLEWIKPFDKAQALLSSIEAQIIFDFKPELNSDHTNNFNSSWPTPILFENYCGYSQFLHGRSSYGPAGLGKLPYVWPDEGIRRAKAPGEEGS